MLAPANKNKRMGLGVEMDSFLVQMWAPADDELLGLLRSARRPDVQLQDGREK